MTFIMSTNDILGVHSPYDIHYCKFLVKKTPSKPILLHSTLGLLIEP